MMLYLTVFTKGIHTISHSGAQCVDGDAAAACSSEEDEEKPTQEQRLKMYLQVASLLGNTVFAYSAEFNVRKQ